MCGEAVCACMQCLQVCASTVYKYYNYSVSNILDTLSLRLPLSCSCLLVSHLVSGMSHLYLKRHPYLNEFEAIRQLFLHYHRGILPDAAT